MAWLDMSLTAYRCSSGKTSWATRSRAKKVGKIFGRKEGKLLRAYRCKLCGAWHLYTKCIRRPSMQVTSERPLRPDEQAATATEVLQAIEDLRRDRELAGQKLDELRVQERRLAADIEALGKRLAEARDARQAVLVRIGNGSKVVAELAQDLQAATGAAAALPDPA